MSYGITVLPATEQRWHSHFYPSQLKLVLNIVTPQTELTYLHIEVVYLLKDSHPSQY